jgi:hypothetical protein
VVLLRKKMGGGEIVGPETVGEKKRLRWRFCVEAERVWMRQGRVDCWIGEGVGVDVMAAIKQHV